MVLTELQILIIGVVALIFAEAFKFFYQKIKNEKPNRIVITVLVYIPAVVMAFFWARPELPIFPDPITDPAIYASVLLQFGIEILGAAAAVAGAAMTIYNLLKDEVYKRLGWS